ncbi:ArsR/SmtB family transcription factor [Vibrio marisflavi]|uniref:HTH arsR-type domain-containing protein n=1 Tax=Vibrio marisflavi CECT 7928 TaxID=634439 RepID=A0ABN8E189_9VIBR|nr:winged helix-turn-helix domain-containing protein [Vibrio marisflavi]CAH0536896.1 hypothetical protein VMF7928_00786 [Vibrio marisflavi CECT 7928]
MSTSCNSISNQAFSATEAELTSERNLASLAKAISHPARIRILKILLTLDNNNGCLNSDLVSELGLAQSTVSEHLKILKLSNLITAEPIPPRVCYRINRDTINRFSTTFIEIFQ